MQKYDIVTFGDLCVDLIMSGGDVVPQFGQVEKLVGDYTLEMGGSCSIFACQAARLGMRVAILGRVGPDAFGSLIIDRMREAGVDTRFVKVDPLLKTGLGIALCKENDRAILTYLGSTNAVELGDISDEFLASARHLHHGSYFLHTRLRPHIPSIFHRARALGLSISLDTNWDPEEQWGEGLASVLPLVDIFFPNEQEALRITKTQSLPAAGKYLLGAGISQVAIKRGEEGVILYTPNQTTACRLPPALPGGDGIGAGDSFDAGFLTAWLNNLDQETCVRVGCLCGRAVASETGGVRGQPDWEKITQDLQNESIFYPSPDNDIR
jgi:ribokinase